jgi:hypothetical protein
VKGKEKRNDYARSLCGIRTGNCGMSASEYDADAGPGGPPATANTGIAGTGARADDAPGPRVH